MSSRQDSSKKLAKFRDSGWRASAYNRISGRIHSEPGVRGPRHIPRRRTAHSRHGYWRTRSSGTWVANCALARAHLQFAMPEIAIRQTDGSESLLNGDLRLRGACNRDSSGRSPHGTTMLRCDRPKSAIRSHSPDANERLVDTEGVEAFRSRGSPQSMNIPGIR
jgi:hypothetical protein